MMAYSQAVVLEGDSPLGYLDLSLFSRPAPVRTEQLFVRRTRRQSPDVAAGGSALHRLLSEPDDLVDVLARISGEPLAELVRTTPVEKMRRDFGETGAEPTSVSDRGSKKGCSVADGYAGIEHAGLVVVNSRHGDNRGPAELSSLTWSGCARTKNLPPTSLASEVTGYPSRRWWRTWPIRMTPGARRPSPVPGGRFDPDRRSTSRAPPPPSR